MMDHAVPWPLNANLLLNYETTWTCQPPESIVYIGFTLGGAQFHGFGQMDMTQIHHYSITRSIFTKNSLCLPIHASLPSTPGCSVTIPTAVPFPNVTVGTM